MNISDLLTILSIIVTVNIGLFSIFYISFYKKTQTLMHHETEIMQNKMILIKTLDQQTLCLEQIFVRICDVENLIERLANNIDSNKRADILRCRNIISVKNNSILKSISELKLFGEDEEYRLSAFKNLVSTGDVKTLDLMRLKIKTEKDSYNKNMYKTYAKRLKQHIAFALNNN